MYERSRPKVRESTKIPVQPPPVRAGQASLTRAEAGGRSVGNASSYGAEDATFGVEGLFIISVAARILDMHPQTLRKYERLGLINPGRTLGMLRLYSREDILRVRLIRRLGNMGLNLAGVEFALSTTENLFRLKRRLQSVAEDNHVRNAIEMEIGAVLRSLNLSVDD